MRNCIFCNTRLSKANRSKEHTIPRWIVRRLKCEDDRFIDQTLTYPNEPNEVIAERVNSINNQILGNVCVSCNGGWMAILETEMIPILEALWTPISPTILTPAQCLRIAEWTFKTAVTISYASEYKKIIPIRHVHDFYQTKCLPGNATVDLAYCARSDRSIQTLQGGNKKFGIRDPSITESNLTETYLVTLHFDHVMLRLGWCPVAGIRSQPIPNESVFRIFPPPVQDIVLQLVNGKVFRDHFQFHFIFTFFTEDNLVDSLQGMESVTHRKQIDL